MQQKTLSMFTKNVSAMQIEEPAQKQHLPWVEKYRPNKIEDLSHQEEVIRGLQGVLKTGNLPHLLLHGPPGTGKTSAIIALSKQLFGQEFWRHRVLELNASDDRGINVVRTKVRKFAEQMTAKNPNSGFLCPNFKIIILDEADSMTQEAQSALRRIIEDYSTNTRFCIICNYITKIIEPLASRCVKYRFKGIPSEQQIERLRFISTSQFVEVDDDGLQQLFLVSGGDLRKSINMLQSASTLYDRHINRKVINEISGVINFNIQTIPDELIQDLVCVIQTSNLAELQDYSRLVSREGYNIEQLIVQFTEEVLNSQTINEKDKAKILEVCALCEKFLIEGSAEDLQVLYLLSQSQKIINNF